MTPEQLERLREQLPAFADDAEPCAALRAFCRAYRIDFSERQARLSHRVGVVASGPYKLAVHYWQQPDAHSNLLLLHGYFDHVGIFDKLIHWGLARNCNVIIFDLPGHGLSSGEPAVIDDFSDYSGAMHAVLNAVSLPPLPLWVMAQSTGAAALVDYAVHYDWPFDATVLLAPLIRPAGWAAVRAGHILLSRFTHSVRRKFGANSSDQDFLDFLRCDPLQCERISLRWIGALRRWLHDLPRSDLGVGPALVVQGDADTTVDWRYNLAFIRALFPGSEVQLLAGAGHQLANEAAHFRAAYGRQIENWLAQHGVALQPVLPL